MQALLPMFMQRMALSNLAQTIPHQELIIPRSKQRSRNINQDSNPAIVKVRERFSAEENSRDNSSTQVPSQVGGDGDVGETPDHSCVCETDSKGSALCGDEWVGGVETGPDDDADVGVDKEFG